MRRLRLAFLLGWAALSACVQEEGRIERYPIRSFLLQYEDPLIAPSLCNPGPTFVTVGAQVGFDNCVLESSQIEFRDDSLFVSGIARCVIRGWPGTGAPAGNNPQMFSLPLPNLEPGDYTLCADGLCGALTVTPACRPAQSTKLYAYGELDFWDSCLVFRTDLDFLSYEATGVELPAPLGRVRIDAVPLCSQPHCTNLCNQFLVGAIQVGSVVAVP